MSEEFLTEGLQSDRYLKALQLIEQFEDEIEAILHEFDQRMVDEQPDLFDSSTGLRVRSNQSPGNGLATHRINHAMNGPRAPDSNQQLNVHLYWMPPTEYNRTDVDGALRAFGYKIKGAESAIDDRVVEQTRVGNWSVKTSENPYDSNIAFYSHVSSADEIEETVETLVRHFSEFGEAYAAGPDEHS